MAVSEPDLNSKEVSLRQAIKEEGFKFPIIVKTCGNEDVYELEDSTQQIPTDSILLLEGQENVCYAHVKLATLEDEKGVTATKGVEYVTEYNRLVGKEFLIPVSLPNKVKIINKPGKRKRYAVISQVLESLPHYLSVEADTSSCFPGSDENKKVPKGTVLEVTNVSSTDGTTFLECKRKNEKHFFSRDSFVNFTAVADLKEYTLENIVSKVLLPKFVKFKECVLPDDVIVYDDESASEALLMTFGPLEVIGKRRRYFITGQLRTKDKSLRTVSYKRILIPTSHWDKEKVQLFTFPTHKAKDAFCKKNFKISKTSQNYENKFYMLPTESTGITYLRTPETMTMPLEDDSSEESQDYMMPISARKPPAPPRTAPQRTAPGLRAIVTEGVELPVTEVVLLPIAKNKVRPDVWQKLAEKAKQGFGNIHNELLYFFSTKDKTQDTADDGKQKVISSPATPRYDPWPSQLTHKESREPKSSVSNADGARKVITTSKAKPEVIAKPKHLPPASDTVGKTSTAVPTRPPKPLLRLVSAPENALKKCYTRRGHLENIPSRSSSVNRPLPPAPVETSETEIEDPILLEYDYVTDDLVHTRTKKRTPAYTKLCAAEIHNVTRKNQTAKDFSEYTVNQVCECFNRCAMEDLARVCWEEKIDGAFLSSFDLDQLKNDPFFLNGFGVNKVKVIIHEGWRPSTGN